MPTEMNGADTHNNPVGTAGGLAPLALAAAASLSQVNVPGTTELGSPRGLFDQLEQRLGFEFSFELRQRHIDWGDDAEFGTWRPTRAYEVAENRSTEEDTVAPSSNHNGAGELTNSVSMDLWMELASYEPGFGPRDPMPLVPADYLLAW